MLQTLSCVSLSVEDEALGAVMASCGVLGQIVHQKKISWPLFTTLKAISLINFFLSSEEMLLQEQTTPQKMAGSQS